MNFLDSLSAIHEKLKTTFTNEAESDKDFAIQLENFLNWTLGDDTVTGNISDPLFQGLMNTTGIREELRKEFQLYYNITSLPGVKSVNRGVQGEYAIAAILRKIIDSVVNSNIETALDKIVMGGAQASVVSRELTDKITTYTEQELKKRNKSSLKDYILWNFRTGKIDVDTSAITIQTEPSPTLQKLLNIRASVKNYSDFRVALESANIKKAYLAIATELRVGDSSNLPKIYDNYIKRYAGQSTMAHLEHLANIYALTGYGQVYKQNSQLVRKFANYLIRVEGNRVQIRSTAQIVKEEILSKGAISESFSSSHYSKSKKGIYKSYYKF